MKALIQKQKNLFVTFGIVIVIFLAIVLLLSTRFSKLIPIQPPIPNAVSDPHKDLSDFYSQAQSLAGATTSVEKVKSKVTFDLHWDIPTLTEQLSKDGDLQVFETSGYIFKKKGVSVGILNLSSRDFSVSQLSDTLLHMQKQADYIAVISTESYSPEFFKSILDLGVNLILLKGKNTFEQYGPKYVFGTTENVGLHVTLETQATTNPYLSNAATLSDLQGTRIPATQFSIQVIGPQDVIERSGFKPEYK